MESLLLQQQKILLNIDIMKYIFLSLFFILIFSVNGLFKGQFSDKINIKRFIREYWEIDKNKSDIKTSKMNISKLIEKYSSKYDVDLNVGDTIFILETCSVESIICYGSLWIRKKEVNFKFHKELKFTSHGFFRPEEIEALFKWNKDIFKLLDEEGRSWLPSNTRYATRIVICNKMVYVDRIEYQYP